MSALIISIGASPNLGGTWHHEDDAYLSGMVLGLGCKPSGDIKEQAHIQGSFKTKAGVVEFQIAIDENGTKFFFE